MVIGLPSMREVSVIRLADGCEDVATQAWVRGIGDALRFAGAAQPLWMVAEDDRTMSLWCPDPPIAEFIA